ncbi:MAG: HAD family phosphatase [Clostridia bacterium]|nr:HAD family phosphatase [Clostridia bacterium]
MKALLLDFDGTTLQRDQVYISFRNMYAIQEAVRKGIEIIPCTGRCADMFPPQIEAEKEIRYWVTSNGGRVVDRATGEVIYQSLFTPEESAMLCRLYEGQQIYSEIAADGYIYMETEIAEHLERYAVPPHHVWFFLEKREKRVEKPSEYFLQHGIGVEKFNIYGVPKEKQQPLIDALLATGIVEISPGAGKDIQFFPKRQKRKEAMNQLFEKLGYGFEEVMSIGDSFLDKDMIVNAKVGVAVGNAADDVKAVADYVAPPFDKDGVADAIEKFIL